MVNRKSRKVLRIEEWQLRDMVAAASKAAQDQVALTHIQELEKQVNSLMAGLESTGQDLADSKAKEKTLFRQVESYDLAMNILRRQVETLLRTVENLSAALLEESKSEHD